MSDLRVVWRGGAVLLLGVTLQVAPALGQDPPRGAVAFDFQDADLRHVITAVAEAGGLNVVFGNLPQRTVTLRTNRAVPAAEMQELLQNLVEANGLRLVEQGGMLRIEAPHAAAAVRDARETEPSAEFRLFVYRLKHARATRLAGTLQNLFGGSTSGTATPGLSRSGLSHELRGQQVPPLRPEALGQPPSESTPATERMLPASLEASVYIVADEMTNSLLVRATDTDWDVIRQAIDALDLRPLQVLIEVLIAEVRRASSFELGVSAEFGPVRDRRTGAIVEGAAGRVSAGDLVLQVMELGPVSADVALSALSSRADVTILSRPVILAQNNQEARILVGSQRPFIQVFRALPTDAAVRDQVVQYREVGTSLTIRPTINHDGYVSLELVQEVSTATNEVQFGAPVISTREAWTQLLVRDRQTVVIGGLIDRQHDRARRGIPVLKDLPLLGILFGTTERTQLQTELFLFLTPHIIRDDDDTERMREGVERGTEHLRRRLPSEPTIVPPRPEP